VIYWEPDAPDDATTSNYSLGAVSEASSKLLQFNTAIDQFLFTGSTAGNQIINPQFSNARMVGRSPAAHRRRSMRRPGQRNHVVLQCVVAYSGTIWRT